jgi:hypothetical protein
MYKIFFLMIFFLNCKTKYKLASEIKNLEKQSEIYQNKLFQNNDTSFIPLFNSANELMYYKGEKDSAFIYGDISLYIKNKSNNSWNKNSTGYINILWFKTKPNTVFDNTLNIQKAIQVAANKCKVIFPKGVYNINADISLNIPSNSNLEFEKDAILKCIPNRNTAYRIINIKGNGKNTINNIIIDNINIIGDRYSHKGDKGEHGHGIVLSNCNNVEIKNPVIKDCWGDGVAIYGAKNVIISHLISDNNRRQGFNNYFRGEHKNTTSHMYEYQWNRSRSWNRYRTKSCKR